MAEIRKPLSPPLTDFLIVELFQPRKVQHCAVGRLRRDFEDDNEDDDAEEEREMELVAAAIDDNSLRFSFAEVDCERGTIFWVSSLGMFFLLFSR